MKKMAWTSIQKFGISNIFNFFEKSLLLSRLHLFYQIYSQNNNIIKK